MSTTTTSTLIDPRVAKEIDEQIELATAAIAGLQAQIATARPAQLAGMAQNLQGELAFKGQLSRLATALANESTDNDPKLVLLAQLRFLAEEARRIADNGRNESRDAVENRGLAIRAITNAVYYALYDDLRAGA